MRSPNFLGKRQWMVLGVAAAVALVAPLLSGLLVCRAQSHAEAPLTVYDDALGQGWQDWSWAQHDLASPRHAHSGKYAIGMTPEGWKGLYLHHDPFSVAGYDRLEVFLHGSAALTVALASSDGKFGPQMPLDRYRRSSPASGDGWIVAEIPLNDLGVSHLGG